MPTTLTHDRGVTVFDAARILQLPESTIRGAIQHGAVRATNVNGRVRITLAELDRYRQYRTR